jgi:hypothetical protein
MVRHGALMRGYQILETALSAAGIPWLSFGIINLALGIQAPSLELLGVGDTPLLQYRGLSDFLVI